MYKYHNSATNRGHFCRESSSILGKKYLLKTSIVNHHEAVTLVCRITLNSVCSFGNDSKRKRKRYVFMLIICTIVRDVSFYIICYKLQCQCTLIHCSVIMRIETASLFCRCHHILMMINS